MVQALLILVICRLLASGHLKDMSGIQVGQILYVMSTVRQQTDTQSRDLPPFLRRT